MDYLSKTSSRNKYLEKIAANYSEEEMIKSLSRHKYVEKDWSHLKHPILSAKYDGSHFFMVVQPDGSHKFYSRRLSVSGTHPERSAQLPHLSESRVPQYAGNVYSVELIHTGLTKDQKESHPTVSGILNSKPELAISTQKKIGPVRAVLLDVKRPEIATFKEKIEHLKQIEKDIGKPDLIFAPEFVEGHENINKYLTKLRLHGREGGIITDALEPENTNLRYKQKNFNTYNLRVKDIIQEIDIHGNPKESMGALVLVDKTGKDVGKVGTGFDRATRQLAWKNRQYFLGKLIQVKAFPPSVEGGKIRFPIYNGFADGNIDAVHVEH